MLQKISICYTLLILLFPSNRVKGGLTEGRAEITILPVRGSGYIEASSALKILILAAAAFSLKLVISNIIIAGGYPRYITFVGGLSLMIGVVLLALLTGKFGLDRAALASALTHFIGLVLTFRYIAKRYMIHRMSSSFARIALASLAASVPAFLFQPRGIAMIFWYNGLMVFFSHSLWSWGKST